MPVKFFTPETAQKKSLRKTERLKTKIKNGTINGLCSRCADNNKRSNRSRHFFDRVHGSLHHVVHLLSVFCSAYYTTNLPPCQCKIGEKITAILPSEEDYFCAHFRKKRTQQIILHTSFFYDTINWVYLENACTAFHRLLANMVKNKFRRI